MDSLLLRKRSVVGRDILLAVVCDGVGSMEHGSYASAYAAKALNQWFDQAEDVQRLGLRLRDRVLEINQEIIAEAEANGLRTASTLSALLLTGPKYYIVHTGDSRVYCWADHKLVQLTTDQSQGGQLTACLGHRGYTDLTYNEGLCTGQGFLICSDGLYKRMDLEHLRQKLGDLKKKNIRKVLAHLVSYVEERGETDNISLALVLCDMKKGGIVKKQSKNGGGTV